MANVAPQSSQTAPQDMEVQEPADDNFYRNLSIAFLIGIVFLFGLFTFMLILLAGAQPA
jgi:hypothetical protein